MQSKLAFVFPGQGSQSIGMLADLAKHHSVVHETFERSSSVLGYDLWSLVQNGPDTELNQTDKTQPAMLTAGVAVWRVWQTQSDIQPDVMAGHSLGEYTAFVCAGALSLESAVSLVAVRGRFMQEAVAAGEGAMAAILGLADEQVIELCSSAAEGQVVEAVNFNSPGQVVVAGNTDAVSRAIDLAQKAGAKRALLLPVSVPSHCQLMKPAALKLSEQLQAIEFKSPQFSVLNNVDAKVNYKPDLIKESLVKQLHKPVRWTQVVNEMSAIGVNALVECGPGKVLAGLTKRIDRKIIALPVYDDPTLSKALEKLGK